MRFKNKEQFINYTQFIPGTFLVIWLLSFAYILYSAPSYPDEIGGRIYEFQYKGKFLYLSLFEEILFYGSIISFFLSFGLLHLISSYYWKTDD